MPTYQVEVGELSVRTDGDGRVNFIHHPSDGRPSIMLSLSMLAAHNLSVILPDYAEQARNEIIDDAIMIMQERSGHDGR